MAKKKLTLKKALTKSKKIQKKGFKLTKGIKLKIVDQIVKELNGKENK